MKPSETKQGALKYELLLLAVSLLWGTTFAAQQIGMENGLGPMTFNALRFSLGALCLVPVLFWIKPKKAPQNEHSFPWMGSVLCGLFLFGAAGFQQVGLLYTSCANGGFITGFYILFVPVIGFFIGQKAPRALWVGVAVCLVGLYFLSVTDSFTIGKGDAMMLICAALWAGQIQLVDRVTHHAEPIAIACVQFTACALLSTLASFIFESPNTEQIHGSWGAIVYAGVFSVAIAFTLQVVCQKRCPPAPAAVIMSFEAVFAALTGYILLEQHLSPRAIFGCALCFAGLLIVQLWPPKKASRS